ncbi:MAG TPA: hypothetical protein VFG83_08195 [Kofleriaceae bacterium]|nr:hypothetical protein [Kofleriaceae bacterium]
MRISPDTVAEVVTEVSSRMTDPHFTEIQVGGFVQSQTPAAQYVGAHADELGGAEKVAEALFHAAVIGLCFQRGYQRTVREMSFEELDYVASGDREQILREQQPAIADYIEVNIESAPLRKVLVLIALAMEWVS